MTPVEGELLLDIGLDHFESLVQLSISVFFYGASFSLTAWGSSTSLISGVFVVLFSASVVIFTFVFSFRKAIYFSPSHDRRKGFSNRVTAAMFVTTVINFLLSSLNTGIQVAAFIVLIRKAPILDTDYEKPDLANTGSVLQNITVVAFWTANLPVSFKLSLLNPVSIRARWRYGSAISLSCGGRGLPSQIDSG